MGNAKRRKQLDPNYGKPLITADELHSALYQQHGRGVLVWWPGLPASYHLPGSAHLQETDEGFLQAYNPPEQAVVSWPVAQGLFLTTITSAQELSQLRYNARTLEQALDTVQLFGGAP